MTGRVVTGSAMSAAVATTIAASASASATPTTAPLGLGRIKRRRCAKEIDRYWGCDERQRQHTDCRNSPTRETMFHDLLHV
jgi:hypothetical protein